MVSFCSHVTSGDCRRIHFKLAFKPQQEQQQLVMLTTCNVEELEQRMKIKIIAAATNLDHMNMFFITTEEAKCSFTTTTINLLQ